MSVKFINVKIIIAVLLGASFIALLAEAAAQTRIDPLPPEEVFIFNADNDGDRVQITYAIPDDYYLYKERFALTINTEGFSLAKVRFSAAENYEDPFFGATDIYYHAATIWAQAQGDGEFELKVISQGCDKQLGICYPPQTHTAMLNTANKGAIGGDNVSSAGVDKALEATDIIVRRNILYTMLVFFGFGLLLSFTPCVLPMLPILLGVIASGGKNTTRKRAATLTAAYISGVVMAYTALGVVAGLSGQLLAPFLQQPPILIFSALLLAALSLSMFGLYDLRMPAIITRLGKMGDNSGAFTMGALSAAIISPCVAAPLVGALIYIGNTGDALSGGLALFSLSLGMSALLAVVGIFGGVIPRGQAWMENIKSLLGVLLLAAAVWILSPLLSSIASLLLYGVLLIWGGVILGSLKAGVSQIIYITRAVAIAALLWGAAMIIGGAAGGRNPLLPLSVFVSNYEAAEEKVIFEKVSSLQQLQQKTRAAERLVMLEFYADWCVSCKEMEAFTFSDNRAREQLATMLLLRADVTENNARDRELLSHFGLYGPPAILFFDEQGRLLPTRIHGYQSADEFLETLATTQALLTKS